MSSELEFILRNEKSTEERLLEEVTREAFWNHYVPGCDEHYLLHIMRKAASFIADLNFVAEVAGNPVGNIVYTNGLILGDDGKRHEVISFGPLAATSISGQGHWSCPH